MPGFLQLFLRISQLLETMFTSFWNLVICKHSLCHLIMPEPKVLPGNIRFKTQGLGRAGKGRPAWAYRMWTKTEPSEYRLWDENQNQTFSAKEVGDEADSSCAKANGNYGSESRAETRRGSGAKPWAAKEAWGVLSVGRLGLAYDAVGAVKSTGA